MSHASPLTEEQQDKMKAELHDNPAMGHARKRRRKYGAKPDPANREKYR